MPGRISVRQRCQRVKWKTEAASRSSVGMAMAPAITLNRMYHCVPSSMRTMDPTPNPPPSRTRPNSTTGNSAVAGTEAAICASGCATFASRGLKPMATPAGMAHSDAITSDAATRPKLAPAACRVDTSSAL